MRLLKNSAVRYLIVGGLSFVVDFGLLAFFYQIVGLQIWLATGIAFAGSFVINYLLQRTFAFQSGIGHGRGLFRYSALVAFNTLATTVLVTLLAATPVGWVLGKIITTGLTTVWNFFVYKYWVFPAIKDSSEDTEPHP